MNGKTPTQSMVEMTELVLPNDTNLLGNLLGGRLLHWIDIAGAMAAQRHCHQIVATAEIDSVEFKRPVKVGEIVQFKAKVTWVGRTSLEVMVEVFSENFLTGETNFTNKAYITFVAIGADSRPTVVPPLLPETPSEVCEYEHAQIRRKERLARKELTCSIDLR
jgi:acyl-CoA hydrolase